MECSWSSAASARSSSTCEVRRDILCAISAHRNHLTTNPTYIKHVLDHIKHPRASRCPRHSIWCGRGVVQAQTHHSRQPLAFWLVSLFLSLHRPRIQRLILWHAIAKARGLRTPEPRNDTRLGPELLELRFWVAPDVETGTATLAWGEEARRDLEGCCGVFG
jgi:hypothetical protein